ncbi:hypothetical protein CTEST_08090 [Corynebacterium testudinoris]|uniref:DUF4439 domain-containing protein n=1 Tax=Corynebacterium testudinoris TaxID=136857 RepID=A0A0G3HAV1_9CORY|nr:hypothetical protein CTEST_08090 [Corynebacterium testudinoris]
MSDVNHRLTLALVMSVPLLASCTVDDIAMAFGPSPNAELVKIANRAAADHRTEELAALEAEIARLCGTHADGSAPQSCAWEPEPEKAPGGDDLSVLIEGTGKAPAESRPLLVGLAVDQAIEQPAGNEFPVDVDIKADVDLVREMLEQEYAAEYAIGVANAFGDPADVDKLREAHQLRILRLQELLAPHSVVPVAEPGYELANGESLPSIKDIERNLELEWMASAVDAQTNAWRDWAVRGAASTRLSVQDS